MLPLLLKKTPLLISHLLQDRLSNVVAVVATSAEDQVVATTVADSVQSTEVVTAVQVASEAHLQWATIHTVLLMVVTETTLQEEATWAEVAICQEVEAVTCQEAEEATCQEEVMPQEAVTLLEATTVQEAAISAVLLLLEVTTVCRLLQVLNSEKAHHLQETITDQAEKMVVNIQVTETSTGTDLQVDFENQGRIEKQNVRTD